MVWQAAQAVTIPICGIGGIETAEDAIKFLLCGATAVQVGTSNYLNPSVAGEIADGMAAYAARHGVSAFRDLVGALEFPQR
jgi:dihydroorotate dehydrogenase (NAD+) catalytic subunit